MTVKTIPKPTTRPIPANVKPQQPFLPWNRLLRISDRYRTHIVPGVARKEDKPSK